MSSLEHTPLPASPASSGFDRTEPATKFIAVFGLVTIALLIALVLGVQAYFDYAKEQQVFVKELEPVASDLKALHAREDTELNTYRYIDRAKGTVRLPINRAMQLVAGEFAAGKVFYPGKPAPVKVQEGASAAAN